MSPLLSVKGRQQKGNEIYSQMLLLSGEWVREGFKILCLVVIYFWMQWSCDFANEQSNLFY